MVIDVLLQRINLPSPLGVVRGQTAKGLQVPRDLRTGGLVTGQQSLVAGKDVCFGGIAGLENLAGQVFNNRLDLARVPYQRVAGGKLAGRAHKVNAAACDQQNCGRKRGPSDTSEGKTHRTARGVDRVYLSMISRAGQISRARESPTARQPVRPPPRTNNMQPGRDRIGLHGQRVATGTD